MLKEIKDFKGYFICDNGKIYSNVGKGNRQKNKTVELYEIKPRYTKNGYARVYMRQTSTNKRVDKYIHRLVAEYFIENPKCKKYVNHKDCNRHNNSADNLEWVTVKENVNQTYELKHLVRDSKGRFVSNFDWQNYSK